MFCCIHIPDFPLAALYRVEPELRSRPLVLLEGDPPLARVMAANPQARAAGIERGMTQVQAEAALSVLADATLRRRSRAQEESAYAALLDCAHSFSPRVEQTAPNAVILDLAGLERLFGPPQNIARRLAQRAVEIGLEPQVAVCSNPDGAHLAALGFAGMTVIPSGKERERLAPLHCDVLLEAISNAPAQAGEIVDVLDRWGVRDLRSLAALPPLALTERLGQRGLELQQRARGETQRMLVVTEPPLDFAESCELEHPLTLLEPLMFVLSRMLEQLCARLASRALAANELRLRLELGDVASNLAADKVFERTLRLPVPMCDAKIFLKLVHLDLQGKAPQAAIIGMHVEAEPARPRVAQSGLFLPRAPEPERLEVLLGRIGGIVGTENVGCASLLDTHAPDAFRVQRFAPSAASLAAIKNAIPRNSRLALRRFRPPLFARVTLRSGEPVFISFLKVRSEIERAAGPWRTSGEWWTADSWTRDEWDIEIAQGIFRLYQDLKSGSWFVEGNYD